MSRARGNRLQNALAAYLTGWFPHAESAGAGRNGTDVLGTPGIVWECKTAVDFKRDFKPTMWVEQSKEHARPRRGGAALPPQIPIVVYFPTGLGERSAGHTLAIVPLHVQMRLLTEAGYAITQNRPEEQEIAT